MSTGTRSTTYAILQEGLSDEVGGKWKAELSEKTPKIFAQPISGRGHSLCGGHEVAAGLCVAAVSEREVEGERLGDGTEGPGDRAKPCQASRAMVPTLLFTQGEESLQVASREAPILG